MILKGNIKGHQGRIIIGQGCWSGCLSVEIQDTKLLPLPEVARGGSGIFGSGETPPPFSIITAKRVSSRLEESYRGGLYPDQAWNLSIPITIAISAYRFSLSRRSSRRDPFLYIIMPSDIRNFFGGKDAGIISSQDKDEIENFKVRLHVLHVLWCMPNWALNCRPLLSV